MAAIGPKPLQPEENAPFVAPQTDSITKKTQKVAGSLHEQVPLQAKTSPPQAAFISKEKISTPMKKIKGLFLEKVKAPFVTLKASTAKKNEGVFLQNTQSNLLLFTRLNRVDAAFGRFKDTLSKTLVQTLGKGFFPIFANNEKAKTLEKKYHLLEVKHQKLARQYVDIKAQISLLDDSRNNLPPNDPKVIALDKEITALNLKADNIFKKVTEARVFLKSSQQLNDEIVNLKISIKALGDNQTEVKVKAEASLNALEKFQNVRTTQFPIKLIETIDKEREFLEECQIMKKKGEATRQSLVALGGERLSLETKDGAKLDGVYLEAKAFREKLISSGGEFISFKSAKGLGEMKGIAFDIEAWEKGESHIINILQDLNAIQLGSGMNAGWTPVLFGSQVVLVPTDSLPGGANDKGMIVKQEKGKLQYAILKSDDNLLELPKTSPIDPASKGGTVILSHGNAGFYERYKDEAIAFLFQGMNVVLFNYRGSGLSEGVPSEQNYKEDIETAYQFTKKKTGQEDHQILFKGLCFGGGASAYAAGKHSQTHLFLDQTYSSFRKLIKEKVIQIGDMQLEKLAKATEEEREALKAKIQKWSYSHLAPLAGQCASLLAPDFQVAQSIKKNKGNKALFYIHDDATISKSHLEKNKQAALEAGFPAQVIFSSGKHSDKWNSLGVKGGELSGEIERLSDQYDPKIGEVAKKIESTQEQIQQLTKENGELFLGLTLEGIEANAGLIEVNDNQIIKLTNYQENLIDEKNELVKKKESALDKLFKNNNLSREEGEKIMNTTYYLARQGMETFLANANLSDPILS